MPVKNIIPGEKVTKAKLERVKELRREMNPAAPSVLRTPPPNTTSQSLNADLKFSSSDVNNG